MNRLISNLRSCGSRRSDRRAGISLIQMQAVIAVTGILTVLGTLWAAQTMKFAQRVRGHQRQHNQLVRLARDLRADVHASQSMAVQDPQRLVLKLSDDQTITYEISDETIHVENKTKAQTRQRLYRLSTHSRAQWETEGLPETVGLIVTRLGHAPVPKSLVDSDSEFHEPDELLFDELPIDVSIRASKSRWPTRFSISPPAKDQAADDDAVDKDGDEKTADEKDDKEPDQEEPDDKSAVEDSPGKESDGGGSQ